jgi:hypothetical protein
MIPYIERDGDPSAPPNYSFPGVMVRSFLLPSDMTALSALCGKLLNIAPLAECGFEFVPLLPFVFVGVLTYPKMLDLDPRFAQRGFASQHELFSAFLVVRLDSMFPGDPLLSQICTFGGCYTFFAYLFVDNPWSMITGREVIGFPKLLANFDPEPLKTSSPTFSVKASTNILSPFKPATSLRPLDFLTIASSAPTSESSFKIAAAPKLVWPWSHFGQGAATFALPGLQTVFSDVLSQFPMSTVQLKQFRDISGDSSACYQAIQTADFTVANLKPGASLPQMDITIPAYDSLKIATTLGIPVSDTGMVTSINQVQSQVDMTYSNITNLFVRT